MLNLSFLRGGNHIGKSEISDDSKKGSDKLLRVLTIVGSFVGKRQSPWFHTTNVFKVLNIPWNTPSHSYKFTKTYLDVTEFLSKFKEYFSEYFSVFCCLSSIFNETNKPSNTFASRFFSEQLFSFCLSTDLFFYVLCLVFLSTNLNC